MSKEKENFTFLKVEPCQPYCSYADLYTQLLSALEKCVFYHCIIFLFSSLFLFTHLNSLVAQMVKNLPAVQQVQSPSGEVPLEKEMATHSSILAWRSPWTEELGGYVHGVTESRTWLSDFHTQVLYKALESQNWIVKVFRSNFSPMNTDI